MENDKKIAEIAEKHANELVSDLQITDIELIDSEVEEAEPSVHSPVVNVESAVPMTALETKIAELYSTGLSTKAISERLGVGAPSIRRTLGKPHIKEFVSDLINAQYTTSIEGRLRIVNRIIESKLEKIEEDYNGDFSKATKKDVVDLLMVADSMLKERQKKELGTSDNVYLSIVNQITGGE